MVSKIRLITVLFFLMFCAGTLYAQTEPQHENDESITEEDDDSLTTLDEKKSSDGPPWALVGEKFALFPTLSIYGGYPEYISADAGFEFAFMSGYSSIVAYDFFAQTEIGTNFGNVDFRFCGGLGMEIFGLFSIQGGGGVELSPNKEPQSFGELMARFIFVNVKCIFTAPENGGSEPDTRYYLGISLGLLMMLMK